MEVIVVDEEETDFNNKVWKWKKKRTCDEINYEQKIIFIYKFDNHYDDNSSVGCGSIIGNQNN